MIYSTERKRNVQDSSVLLLLLLLALYFSLLASFPSALFAGFDSPLQTRLPGYVVPTEPRDLQILKYCSISSPPRLQPRAQPLGQISFLTKLKCA